MSVGDVEDEINPFAWEIRRGEVEGDWSKADVVAVEEAIDEKEVVDDVVLRVVDAEEVREVSRRVGVVLVLLL